MVQVVRPHNKTESVAELIRYRPRSERRILQNCLMAPIFIRDISGTGEVCKNCKKPITAGLDCFRIDSPADENGPHIVGTACSGCINEMCHSLEGK
jgi:hypothetical protein